MYLFLGIQGFLIFLLFRYKKYFWQHFVMNFYKKSFKLLKVAGSDLFLHLFGQYDTNFSKTLD